MSQWLARTHFLTASFIGDWSYALAPPQTVMKIVTAL